VNAKGFQAPREPDRLALVAAVPVGADCAALANDGVEIAAAMVGRRGLTGAQGEGQGEGEN